MAPPSRRTSTVSATPGPSQTPATPRKSRAFPRYVAVPEDTMIPTIMQSSAGRTLFSASWWVEITKKDNFWKEFEKHVARSTIDRRLRSLIGSKHVRVVTEFKTRQRKAPDLGQGLSTYGAVAQETPEVEDEMDDQEDADQNPEEKKPVVDDTADVKPSIEVVFPLYSSISANQSRAAGEHVPKQATAATSVKTTYSIHSFVTLPIALPTPAPTPASPLALEIASLKRKYDEIIAGHDTINPEAEADTIKTDADAEKYDADEEVTIISSVPTSKPLSFLDPATKKEEADAAATATTPAPPKKTIKLEEDSEEYREFQRFQKLKERMLRSLSTEAEGVKVEGI